MKKLVKALGILTFIGGVWKLGKLVGGIDTLVGCGLYSDRAQVINDVLNNIKEETHSIKKVTEPEEETMTEEESVEGEGEAEPEEE